MKYLISFSFILLLFLASCSENGSPNNDTTKETDQTNYENVTKTKSTSKTDNKATADRKPSTPKELEKARAIIAAVSSDDLATVDGQKIFKSYCIICHGITGDLNVSGATDLTASTLPLEERVAQVYNGRGLMTPFKEILKDKEIVAVGKYVENLRK